MNPVVGPEAITGSSRMKGGTATLAILHSAFATALSQAGIAQASDPASTPDQGITPAYVLETLHRTAAAAHASATRARVAEHGTTALAQAMQMCAQALRDDKRCLPLSSCVPLAVG